MNISKNNLLRVRLSEEENGHLRALADAESISVSDYVRRRLFEDYTPDVQEVVKPKNDNEGKMMHLILMTFVMVKAAYEQSVTKEKMSADDQIVKSKLKEWGYE